MADAAKVASHKFLRVAGFAVVPEANIPVVCVRIEDGDGLGVWIGRSWPGDETYVITNPAGLERVSIEEVRVMLETWPATRGKEANAIQSAAMRGRRELIEARLQAGLNAP